MLTIRQLLALPVMADGALVAGASGVDREALWAAVVDIPRAYEWVRPGELLLTTFFGLKDDADGQIRLVHGLIEKGVSGMVVASGQYVAHVPDDVRAIADEMGFPIIELPWDVPFEDVTRAVSEHSINDQYLLYKQSLAIHRALTRLVLEGGTLQDVAHELCSLIRRPVEIDDLAFAVVAEASLPGARLDESRRSAVREGRSSPRLLDHLRRSGALSQARQTMSAQRVDVTDETRALGMTMPRILAPIVVARRVYGYV
ncbi:MAG TPA: PucR family transcriptional regulator ligand-binding domain-containing protein [Ktedonobacterales bacterium]|nr:PucR family transcriptional regulator ligand-binding domain-containing protein [Ktedonobacterales bacterium]